MGERRTFALRPALPKTSQLIVVLVLGVALVFIELAGERCQFRYERQKAFTGGVVILTVGVAAASCA